MPSTGLSFDLGRTAGDPPRRLRAAGPTVFAGGRDLGVGPPV